MMQSWAGCDATMTICMNLQDLVAFAEVETLCYEIDRKVALHAVRRGAGKGAHLLPCLST